MKEKYIIYPENETKPDVGEDKITIKLKIEDYLLIKALRDIARALRNGRY